MNKPRFTQSKAFMGGPRVRGEIMRENHEEGAFKCPLGGGATKGDNSRGRAIACHPGGVA